MTKLITDKVKEEALLYANEKTAYINSLELNKSDKNNLELCKNIINNFSEFDEIFSSEFMFEKDRLYSNRYITSIIGFYMENLHIEINNLKNPEYTDNDEYLNRIKELSKNIHYEWFIFEKIFERRDNYKYIDDSDFSFIELADIRRDAVINSVFNRDLSLEISPVVANEIKKSLDVINRDIENDEKIKKQELDNKRFLYRLRKAFDFKYNKICLKYTGVYECIVFQFKYIVSGIYKND